MKLIQWLLIVLICVLMGCQSDSAPPEDRVATQHIENTIEIGMLHSLSVRRRNASVMAVQHINNAGGVLGKDFNVVFNSIGTVDETVEKAIPMMDEYNMQALIVTSSSRVLAVAEEAIPREVVVLSESATSPILTGYQDNGYLFRVAPSDVFQSVIMANEAANFGVRSTAFVYTEDDPYGEGLAAEFERHFLNNGGEQFDSIAIPESTSVGFEQYHQEVFVNPPDLIVLSMARSASNAHFINEATSYNYQGFYLLADSAVNTGFSDNIANPEALSNTYGITPSKGLENYDEFTFFEQSFLAFQGEAPQNYDSNAYDAVIVLALAIEDAGYKNQTDNPTGKMIRDSLLAVMNPDGIAFGPSSLEKALNELRLGGMINYQGAYSSTDFDANGDIQGILVYDIFQFTAGGFQRLAQVTVNTEE